MPTCKPAKRREGRPCKPAADLFRAKLRELRTTRGWTQEEMARRLDVHPDTVRYWESGHRHVRMKQIHRICIMLGLGPDDVGELMGAFQFVRVISSHAHTIYRGFPAA